MAGFDVVYARLSPPSRSPSPPAHEQIGVHPSDLTIGPHSFPDAGPHLRAALGLPHGAPVSLWSLTEPPSADIKPCVPYPMLMQLAIYGSEEKRLTLQGIYNAIAERFAYFREQDSMGILSWRKSMRHALSLYSVFVKIPKPLDMDIPGKGCAWILNISAINGSQYSRARKRRGSKSKSAPTTEKKAVGTRQRKSKYVEDASDCTSVSDVDESNLYPDFRQDRSVSPSVSSSMADASSSASAIGESATRVSSRLRSHSAATKKAANRGRRSRTLI
ncbi:fork head domain-containing protein [Mycena polygramma]|nr:fork head domain-containing protein [Mycena polygramma]